MPKICYEEKKFRQTSLELISVINEIIEEYTAAGFDLTLRQTYYQLVARGYIENTERSYKNTGSLINDARLAGLIDWYAITDRTRNLRGNSHWERPQDILSSARYSYMLDRWKDQPNYVEVWIEKDALVGVISSICNELDVPYFSCRGYTSQSEMWRAARRFQAQWNKESRTIIHLGDHDPSGIDMTRDIQDRLDLFGADAYVKRVALTMDQIDHYAPPPNPTKLSDARASGYIKNYGYECWELDALEPSVITALIKNEVTALIDKDIKRQVEDQEDLDKRTLSLIEENYEEVMDFVMYL